MILTNIAESLIDIISLTSRPDLRGKSPSQVKSKSWLWLDLTWWLAFGCIFVRDPKYGVKSLYLFQNRFPSPVTLLKRELDFANVSELSWSSLIVSWTILSSSWPLYNKSHPWASSTKCSRMTIMIRNVTSGHFCVGAHGHESSHCQVSKSKETIYFENLFLFLWILKKDNKKLARK